ncbi:protein FAM135A-like isoform X1 [Branchiostoma lanceolatum]|uniref:protein FAM135A-like isoform X1 n=1 Tax=Branchiostoma lanceolatum TaxID=7740 RepID=UPI003455979F
MGELQATVEFSVAFGKFYNVDLFQRGFYHVRAYFKPPLRPPMKTEVHLADSSGYEHVYPAQVKEVTTGVSKTFQILYKNEEVTVNDIFLFKVHVLVDSDKIEDTVDSAAFQLVLDLCFSEESADNGDSLQVVSSRVLKLHLCANKGLHHHAVVMFDYFHLCAMEVAIHGCLVTLHQPIMNIPKTAKSGWLKGQSAGNKLPLVSLESILFGAVNMNKAIMPAPKGTALAEAMAQARDTHRQMCAALLSSYAGLQEMYQELLAKTPDKYLFRLEVSDTDSRLETLCEAMKIVKTQDEAIQTVTSHLTQLCADLCALWTQFLDMVTTSTPIAQYLSDNNHQTRVQRFCEAFFTVENPRQSALAYSDNGPQGHAHIGAMVRNSCYFATLPPVPVECAETDGDATTLPIIFEDRYVANVKEVPSMDLSDVNTAGDENKRRSSLPFSRKDNKRSSKDKKSGSSSSLNRSESQGSKDGDSTGAKSKRRGSKGRLKFGSKTSQFIKNMKPESLKRPSQSAGLDPVVLLGYRQLEKSINKKTEPEIVGSSSDEEAKLKRRSEPIPLQLLTNTGSKNNASSLPDIVTLEVLSADSGPQPAKFAWSETNVADTTRETSFTDARQSMVKQSSLDSSLPSGKPSFLLKQGSLDSSVSLKREVVHNVVVEEVVDRPEDMPISSRTEPDGAGSTPSGSNQSVSDSVSCETGSNKPSVGSLQSGLSQDGSDQTEVPASETDGEVKASPVKNRVEGVVRPNKSPRKSPKFGQLQGRLGGQAAYASWTNLVSDEDGLIDMEIWDDDDHSEMSSEGDNTCLKSVESTSNQELPEAESCDQSGSNNHDLLEKKSISLESSPKSSGAGDVRIRKTSLEHREAMRLDRPIKCQSWLDIVDLGVTLVDMGSVDDIPKLGDSQNGSEVEKAVGLDASWSATETVDSGISESLEGKDSPGDANQLFERLLQPTPHAVENGHDPGEERRPSLSDDIFRQSIESAVHSFLESDLIQAISLAIGDEEGDDLGSFDQASSNSNEQYGACAAEEGTFDEVRTECKTITTFDGPGCQVRSEKVTTFDTANAGPPPPSWSQEQLLTESRLMTTFGSEVHLETVGGPTQSLEHNDPTVTSIPTESKIETTFGADGDSPSGEEQSSQDVVDQNVHDDVPSKPSTDVETPVSDVKTPVSDVTAPVSDVNSQISNVNPPITKQPTKSEVSTVEAIPMSGDLGSTNGEATTAKEKLASLMALRKMSFKTAKAELLKQLRFPGQVYSNLPSVQPLVPYFYPDMTDDDGLHLIVCVHGLDGNSADLRLVRTYLELGLPGTRMEFLMSERNQVDTFADFDVMTDRLVSEIQYYVEVLGMTPTKVSFIGHSLGNIIIRSVLTRPEMVPFLDKLHTLLSLSGPHLGTLYNNSALVNTEEAGSPRLGETEAAGDDDTGMWFMQKWKKSGSLLQLAFKDHPDPRHTFLYRLSQKPGLALFKNVLLVGSVQDRYVPFHSARIEMCKSAVKDKQFGAVYTEMINNILQPVVNNPDVNLVRYDVIHSLPNTANSLIGRAAHIAVLDSEIFIEKFMLVTGLQYFK